MVLKSGLWAVALILTCGVLLAGCKGEQASTSEAPTQDVPSFQAATPTSPVTDEEVMALASRNNCFFCHALDQTVTGPAWRDVAKKYRGDPKAQAWLENKILNGGGGVWGNEEKMPAHPHLSAEERAQLARFILNLK